MNLTVACRGAIVITAAALLGGCTFDQPSVAALDPAVFEAAYERSGRPAPAIHLPARLVVARVGYAQPSRYEAAYQDPPVTPLYGRPNRFAPQAVPTQSAGLMELLRTPDSAASGPIRQAGGRLSGVSDVLVLQPEMTTRAVTDVPTLLDAGRAYGGTLMVAFSLSTTTSDHAHVPIVTVLTLGLVPNVTADAEVTVRAALLDLSSGRVLERYETHAGDWQLTSYYVIHESRSQAAERAQTKALAALLDRIEHGWSDVVHSGHLSALPDGNRVTTPAAPTPSRLVVGGADRR